MEPQALLQRLSQLDNETAISVVTQVLQSRPELAPAVINHACPDLTYAPTRAVTDRRCTGMMKELSPQTGYAAISCPELAAVFGTDVLVHRRQLGSAVAGQSVSFAVTLTSEGRPQAFDVMANAPGGTNAGTTAASTPGMSGGTSSGAVTVMAGGMESTVSGMDMQQQAMLQQNGGGMKGCGKFNQQQVLGEYYGILKNYNTEKFFGFIACDALKHDHEGDVYVHAKHIGEFKVGQEVKFQAYLHQGRLQGRDLQDATGRVGPQTGSAGPPGTAGNHQDIGAFIGIIKNFNSEKGFGFIVCEDLKAQGFTGDAFLHRDNLGEFKAGDHVSFQAYTRDGKLRARDLKEWHGGIMPSTVVQAMGGFASPPPPGEKDPNITKAAMKAVMSMTGSHLAAREVVKDDPLAKRMRFLP